MDIGSGEGDRPRAREQGNRDGENQKDRQERDHKKSAARKPILKRARRGRRPTRPAFCLLVILGCSQWMR